MNKRIPIIIGFILVLLAIWLQVTSVQVFQQIISRLESLSYDVQLRTRLLTQSQEVHDSAVVIVDIDDRSLNKEGRWPWPRAKLGQLVNRLNEEGAVVIAFDMIFPEKEDNIAEIVFSSLNQKQINTTQIDPLFKKIIPLFDNDALFAESLKVSTADSQLGVSFSSRPIAAGILPNPVLSLTSEFDRQLDFINTLGYVGNISILQNSAKSAGFVNVFADVDGIIRRVPLLLRYKDNLYPSLALEAVRLYLLSDVKLVTGNYGEVHRLEGVSVGNHLIPTDATGQVTVPFRGKSFTYPYYSATDVLNKKIPKESLVGKIIFIGTSATGLGDLKPTAVDSSLPGVEIHASIADGILTDNFSYKPTWAVGVEVILTLVLGSLFAFSFPFLGPRVIAVVLLIVPTGLIFGNNLLWGHTGLIISNFFPIVLSLLLAIVNIVYGYVFETRKREHLKSIFGQYVPAEHINEMLKASGSYGMYGEDREMTVLFADIRNFTAISEHMSASQIKEMLNDLFTPMTEIIFKHHGTIDKYVGDLIMAFWGAPLKDKWHTQHAIEAALEMQEAIKLLQPDLTAHGWPEMQIGIGLNSGVMSVGDMGSKFRRNYTVLGDAVNLASRVEGLSKYYGVKIILTEYARKHQKKFLFRQLDRVRVKGKSTGIDIYEVVCEKALATPEVLREVEFSQMALNCYFGEEWVRAKDLFTELHAAHPDVVLYKLYLKRLAIFEKEPPENDWGGIFTHTAK